MGSAAGPAGRSPRAGRARRGGRGRRRGGRAGPWSAPPSPSPGRGDPFGDPQRAEAARVGGLLLPPGRRGCPAPAAPLRAPHTQGRSGGQSQTPGPPAEAVLDDAVLAGVVGQHGDPASGTVTSMAASRAVGSTSSSALTSTRIAWNVRRPDGRRGAGSPPGSPPDDLGELAGRAIGRAATIALAIGRRSARRRSDGSPGPGRRLVAVDDVGGRSATGSGPCACRAGRRGGRRSRAGRGRTAETTRRGRTAPRSVLDRHRQARGGPRGGRRSGLHDGEAEVAERGAGGHGRRSMPRGRGRCRRPTGRRGFRARLGVAASTERGVDHDPGGHGRERGDDLVDHHRAVLEGVVGGTRVGGSGAHQRRLTPGHRRARRGRRRRRARRALRSTPRRGRGSRPRSPSSPARGGRTCAACRRS